MFQHEYTAQQAKAAAAAVSGSASLGAPPTNALRGGTAVRSLQPAPKRPPVMLAPTTAKPAGWHDNNPPPTAMLPPTAAPLSPQNPIDTYTPPQGSTLGTQPTTSPVPSPTPLPPPTSTGMPPGGGMPAPPPQSSMPTGSAPGCAPACAPVGSPPDEDGDSSIRVKVPMRDGSYGRSLRSVPMRLPRAA